MKLVAAPDTRTHVGDRAGSVYVWARAVRCCAARTYVLEVSTEVPDKELQLVHTEDGIEVYAPPGLVEPAQLELEVDRRGRLRAYWNGQAWIG